MEIGGAKNAALAILAAAIMTDETVLIDNLPDVNDINVLLDAIAGIGASVHRIDRHTVRINGKGITNFDIEYEYTRRSGRHIICWVRYSASTRKQLWRFRGGCNIGSRPTTSI